MPYAVRTFLPERERLRRWSDAQDVNELSYVVGGGDPSHTPAAKVPRSAVAQDYHLGGSGPVAPHIGVVELHPIVELQDATHLFA